MHNLILNGLLNYLKDVKEEIEKEGLIATIDEAILRVEKSLEIKDRVELDLQEEKENLTNLKD